MLFFIYREYWLHISLSLILNTPYQAPFATPLEARFRCLGSALQAPLEASFRHLWRRGSGTIGGALQAPWRHASGTFRGVVQKFKERHSDAVAGAIQGAAPSVVHDAVQAPLVASFRRHSWRCSEAIQAMGKDCDAV